MDPLPVPGHHFYIQQVDSDRVMMAGGIRDPTPHSKVYAYSKTSAGSYIPCTKYLSSIQLFKVGPRSPTWPPSAPTTSGSGSWLWP